MAASGPRHFPLLVEGSWGYNPPQNLSTKLQVYFQSQKKSGGGECEVRRDPGNPDRFLVLFYSHDVRQKVLERENHVLVWSEKGNFKLTVQLPRAPDEVHKVSEEKIPTTKSKTKKHGEEPDASEDTKMEDIPSLVAFENLQATMNDMMLVMLVENISGMSSVDFQLEIIRDLNVAIVTFQKYIDVMKFVDDCTKHTLVKKLQLSPRLLEVTKTIRVENLPPGVDNSTLKGLFENPQNGGGKVLSIECFPDESSALIEFFDKKVLDTIMTKKLDINNMPLSVFPYYASLGTALYGKEKPVIKLPAPFKERLDLHLWKFLYKNNHLIEEINEEVRRCHCELTWSQLDGEVTIRPAATLVNQGRQRIKNWKKDVSTAFSDIKSRYKVTLFKVDPIVWDAIKNNLEDDRILIEFDTLTGVVTLLGKSEDIQNIEPQIKELIENTTQKIKREEQSVQEKVAVSPGKYSLLCLSGVQEHFCTEYPEMEISYDKDTQHMCFKGLNVEVYKVKCEIQEKVYNMAQKSIQPPPEVVWFLRQVDCAQFSKSLFITRNILAVYELKDITVFLTGCFPQDLLEAEMQMESALSYKRINIEDKELLNSKKWKVITGNLHKKHNSSSKTVIINEVTSETTGEVMIAGCVKEVDDVYSLLYDFVEKNTKIVRLFEINPPLVLDYLKAEKKLFLQKMKKINVHVEFNSWNKPRGILLTGSKAEVLQGMNILKEARDSVFVKTICIDKPGASQVFQDKAWYCKREVRQSFGCFVELLQDEEKEGGGTDEQKCYYSRTDLGPGISLIVQQGDLTQFPVEVVVNSANEDLRLNGGLGAALSKAAGPELQADCYQIVKDKGKIPPGHATISKAGKLPYHHVIHAVGPVWEKKNAQQCEFQLKRAVEESLHLAEKYQHQSIAIPAISSGNYHFPLSQCVKTIVLAIKENFQYNSDGRTLKEIYLVDSAEKTVEAFVETVNTVFKDTPLDTASPPSFPAVPLHQRKGDGSRRMLVCPGGLRILLVKEDVQNATTDVVVNSISRDLDLSMGPLSKALLEKAGPNLQKELSKAGQGKAVDVGTVLQTSGCNLHCQQVLHVVAPPWNNGDTSSYKIMEDIIRECLTITENLSLKSIGFPAIGTGNLEFPKTIFAELIISEVFKFSSNSQPTALQEVCFLLHPNDDANIQAFSDEFDKRANGNFVSHKMSKTGNTQGLHGPITSPSAGVYEMKIGPITFQVASGDITKEEADIIVNSTSHTFNLKAGVSKAILEQAGQNVEMECSHLAQKGKNNGYIITGGGLLKCKNIIHVAGGNDVKTSVSCVLQESEKRNYSSICLPAIGTGNANKDPDKVASAIIEAIEDFIQKGSVKSVKKVKVVIFLPQILDVFYDNMKKREGSQASATQSMMSKIASFLGFSKQSPPKQKPLVLEKKTELAIFQVCGENEKLVEQALCWIQNLIKKEQNLYTSTDECIKDFGEQECQELNKLQKTLNIIILLDHQKPLIEVSGTISDVLQARNAIEDMLKIVKLAKEQELKADYVSDFVEWQYNDNNTIYNFDKMTNLQLEDAKKKQTATINIKINNQKYTVDLKTYIATDAKGHRLSVQRHLKPKVETPGHWRDMKQENVCLVELQPGHAEYNNVADKFNKTCAHFKIEKIQRIQNPGLWKSYQMKKRNMDDKNGQVNNERLLFHGTDVDSLPHVNLKGFNRSYAGKNATAFGKGTYFAVNAKYSANDTYSKPDVNGNKYIYYVRVLTGLFTVGNRSLIVPPPKNPLNPTDLYDTVTDNVNNPSLFVVFYDDYAYPEYLITFKQ